MLERFLAVHGLKEGPRFLRLDQGHELMGSDKLRGIVNAAGYSIEPTGSDLAWQNGKVERLNGMFGIMVRCLLYSAGLSEKICSDALIHAVYLKNRLYNKAIGKTPYEGWTGIKPELYHLQNFGALVTVRKPGKRPAKTDQHTAYGVLLGLGSSTKQVRYFDLTTNREKLSSHHFIDESHYNKARRQAGAQVLMDMGYDIPSLPLIPLQPLKPSVYPTWSRHKCIAPLSCTLIPLPLHEFTPAPVAVEASLAPTSRLLHDSDVHHNDGIIVTFSTDPFGTLFPEKISVSGIHPTLGLDIRHGMDSQSCQLVAVTPGTLSRQLPQWRLRLCHAFPLSMDTTAVHTILDVHQAIALARQAAQTSVVIVFTKDEAKNSLSAVGLPKLYFDQLRVMKAHIVHNVQAVVHKAMTGPKFNGRSLQKQSDWSEWRASEWVQLDNYDKQGMFGTPCTAPIDAFTFFWVWLYSIKPHENNCKKVHSVCDGSTRGGQMMIHGDTYAPTPQHIDFCIQISIATTRGMFLWHANVSNAFREADRLTQMYYLRCDSVFRKW
jgi:hypothetical protein